MNVCIKNINKDDWRDFRSESIKHGLRLGDFFKEIVEEHLDKCKESNWEKILYGEKKCKGILSQSDLHEIKSEFREKFRLRN